jgi:myo-inositol-1(or 4)-monophosphatase
MGDFYVAIKGHGATLNGHPIHVSNRSIDRAWIAFSAAKDMPGIRGLGDDLEKLVHRVRSFGAAGFVYPSIAAGNLEGVVQFHGHGHEWDFAPGTLLVQEAGGRVGNIGSDKYDYRKFDHIAANPIIFDQLMEFMDEVNRDTKDSSS